MGYYFAVYCFQKSFSFPSELSVSINVTFFPFCYFSGKYLQALSSVEIEAEKQKTCWKQLVIFFIHTTVFLWPNQVCVIWDMGVYC